MIRFTVTLDRGRDLGRNYGSLFEARSSDGTVTLGAGFQGVCNTNLRLDRHTVQFFARPASGDRAFNTERLPRAGDAAGVYLVDVGDALVSARDGLRRWDEAATGWQDLSDWGGLAERVGPGRLRFVGSRVEYDGRTVLEPPERGAYGRHYYAQGFLCFYHIDRGSGGYRPYENDESGFSKLVACPWDPGSGEPANMARAVTLTLPVVGETTFAWGQRGTEVVTCSNIGGLYLFDGKAWRMVRDPELGRSYQVYTMLHLYDRFFMGQYPTGELFELRGDEHVHVPGWPPRMEGVTGSAREAQTAVIYGGELYVGVWPWGEIWRYSPDAKRWSFVQRMFPHPAITDRITHPYEKECAELGGVANQWGQRVTSLVPVRDTLVVGTSAKWPCDWKPEFAFVGDGKWKDYGAIYRLRTPGNLSVPLAWTDGKTTLTCDVTTAGLRVSQDGKVLGTATLDGPLGALTRSVSKLVDVTWGDGVFGPFAGKSVTGTVTTAGAPADR